MGCVKDAQSYRLTGYLRRLTSLDLARCWLVIRATRHTVNSSRAALFEAARKETPCRKRTISFPMFGRGGTRVGCN